MSVLELSGVSASPWGKPLLSEITFEAPVGSILGIVGPNGAGKTSLLRLIAGDFTADKGNIQIMGRSSNDWSAGSSAKQLAYLPQFSLLSFPYTVEEVVMLGRTPHKTGIEEDRHIVEAVLAKVDIAALRDRLYTQLSGGEKQRVQLARVLAQIWDEQGMEHKLLLLDEPTTALDMAHQQELLDIIRDLKRRLCTVLVVIHDFNVLASIADQVVVLDQGRQVAQGQPLDIYTPALFAELFDTQVLIDTHPTRGYPLVVPQ
ncbi:MAG: heme ABC transporter ATP-binding protein [Halieaceae bacterium]